MVNDCFNNACPLDESCIILILWVCCLREQEGTTNKFFGINSEKRRGCWLNCLPILARLKGVNDRILDSWELIWVVIIGVNRRCCFGKRQAPVERVGIACRSNCGSRDELTCIFCNKLESHGMTNVFRDTDEPGKCFTCFGRQAPLFNSIINWFIEFELEEGANIRSNTCKKGNGGDPSKAFLCYMVMHEACKF